MLRDGDPDGARGALAIVGVERVEEALVGELLVRADPVHLPAARRPVEPALLHVPAPRAEVRRLDREPVLLLALSERAARPLAGVDHGPEGEHGERPGAEGHVERGQALAEAPVYEDAVPGVRAPDRGYGDEEHAGRGPAHAEAERRPDEGEEEHGGA